MKPVASICYAATMFAAVSFVSTVVAQPAAPSKEIDLHNAAVAIHYHRDSGLMDISWKDGHTITGLASGAVLEDGRSVSSAAYTSHVLEVGQKASDVAGTHVYVVKSTAPGLPELVQRIWLYDKVPAIAVQAELQVKTGSVGYAALRCGDAEGAGQCSA